MFDHIIVVKDADSLLFIIASKSFKYELAGD